MFVEVCFIVLCDRIDDFKQQINLCICSCSKRPCLFQVFNKLFYVLKHKNLLLIVNLKMYFNSQRLSKLHPVEFPRHERYNQQS